MKVNIKIFIIFAMSFRMLKALRVITLRRDTYILKAFSGRFGFDILRISQIHLFVKSKATGTPLGGVVSLHIVIDVSSYIHRRGAFSVARFRLSGQCESLYIVDRAQNWLHVFCVYGNV